MLMKSLAFGWPQKTLKIVFESCSDLIDRFCQLDIFDSDAVGIVRAQSDRQAVVDVFPIRVVILGLGQQGYRRHKTKSFSKVLKLEISSNKSPILRPQGEVFQGFYDLRLA